MKQLSGNTPITVDNAPFSIPTYIINLKKRTDRKEHVLAQFQGREEFALTVVEAYEHSYGAWGLWATIRHILYDMVSDDAAYIIIGEDDIQFTENYSKETLFVAITEAEARQADVLLGGVSWFDDALHISENLFWASDFTGLHFTVLFKKFFKTLIEVKIRSYVAADHKIARLTDNCLFMYPPMAIQKEFGYSDATPKNSVEGSVPGYFESVSRRLLLLNTIKSNIDDLMNSIEREPETIPYETVILPTYVINLPERTERLAHIKQEFLGKPEFDVQIIEACKHEVGALGLWLSIRKIINLAIANDDDVIVIAEDDHQFTKDYTKEYLIKNIIEAHEEGACYLSGGTGKFNNAMPLTSNRFWVYNCLSTQFVVIYKKFFQQILDEPYDEKIIADLAYSRMTSNKMVLYPFVSTQKDFGYSDITIAHQENKNLVTNMFLHSAYKFRRIRQAYMQYHPQQELIQTT
jgi:GR25 family glycosyltransferase involved in LPS biosynthesis